MSILTPINQAIETHNRHVAAQIQRARTDPAFQQELLTHWKTIQRGIETVATPTGLKLPRLALPQTDEPGEIARYLYGEGLPGEFPFVNGIYPEMYLDPLLSSTLARERQRGGEEPTRLFAGLDLAEDTNKRFHTLTKYQKNIRLSTAFDGPTLYGLDSDAEGVFGKIGEGGVAIATIDDMEQLYAVFRSAMRISPYR